MSGGTLDDAAVGLHEMFQSFIRAGFTEDQAFRMVRAQWKAIVGAGTTRGDE